MNRFRIRNNVPDVYVKESRDFQLMCDLFDIINNGVKFDIDTIMDLSDTLLCRESMLPYLQQKLGLKLSKEITSENLRTILKCFPYLVKYKGCRKGVEEAIALFLHIIFANCSHKVEIVNKSPNSGINGLYIVEIELEDNVLKRLHILDDILKYVLPAGYKLEYDLKYLVDDIRTEIYPLDKVNIVLVNEHLGSNVRKAYNLEIINDDESVSNRKVYDDPRDGNSTNKLPGVIGAIGTTVVTLTKNPSEVINSNDYKDLKEKGFMVEEINNNESN